MYKAEKSTKLLSAILVSSLVIASCSVAGERPVESKEEKKSGWITVALKKVWPLTGIASAVAIGFALKNGTGKTKLLTLCVGAAGSILSSYGFIRFMQDCKFEIVDQEDDKLADERYLEFLEEKEMAQLLPPKPIVTHVNNTNNHHGNCSCHTSTDELDDTSCRCNNKNDDKSCHCCNNHGTTKPCDCNGKKEIHSNDSKSFGLEKPFSKGLNDFWEDPLGF